MARPLALAAALTLLVAAPALAQDEAPKKPVRIGVSPVPPLVVIPEGGKPRGFDVSLWEAVAADLELETELVVVPTLKELLDRVEAGELDAALSGITINAKREARFDFSHQYLRSGLSILTRPATGGAAATFLGKLFSTDNLPWFAGSLLFIALSALLCWWSERGEPGFSDDFAPGFFEACYWVVVTMSTVGYGDYAPKRWLGRGVAVFVIFTGISLYGTLIAKGASALTVSELQADIAGPDDLAGRRVATVAGTTSVDAGQRLGATMIEVDRVEDAYAQLRAGTVDAVVYDWPTLRHYAQQEGRDLALVGGVFDPQYYGVLLPQGSPLRERVNRALLRLEQSGVYRRIYDATFGEQLR